MTASPLPYRLPAAGPELLGHPLGLPVPDWQGAPFPPRRVLSGYYCRVEPLEVERHAESLWAAMQLPGAERNWAYVTYGPFERFADYRDWLAGMAAQRDPQFYVAVDVVSGEALGVASYLRIDPVNGAIEVGHLNFSPRMQRSRAATEMMYLMMANAFALGYRRYEWKCNALNQPSSRAALRLGFQFEGVFRQARVDRGRNRDTAWYSILDGEWPALRAAFETWLTPDNFDAAGRQRQALSTLTAQAREGLA
ncbi:GNAT family protein [Crenobacter sp. SG2303]|uniref:GNAT family protein n=1 Tax=Crenobacter oryzisoli TaxID=3056844 RepID=A0ABT7XTS4_9NEIS|nr:GNAT family protein [Crenobacter sp. SG2303]MDN0077206.1 GNAT family protein [Crenobacter sp. SG2303]